MNHDLEGPGGDPIDTEEESGKGIIDAEGPGSE